MDQLGVDIAVLSLPALASGETSSENRALARERNLYAFQIRQKYPNDSVFSLVCPSWMIPKVRILYQVTGSSSEVS